MNRSGCRFLILLTLLPWLGACSMGQMVARSSTSILDGGVDAMNRETDLQLAEAAIPANLKLVEGLLQEDPDNTTLLENASQGFYGYAFGFVELQSKPRAEALYHRCYRYGNRLLKVQGLSIDLLHANPDEIDQAISGLGKNSVPALFWTASCWAKTIDLNREDPTMIAQLASTERLMQRVKQLQPDYYYGGVDLFYGVYYGSRAPMLGGDPDKSEQSFSAARTVTQGKLLMVDVLQAEYLERQRFDQQHFNQLLMAVIQNPVGSFPEMALANQIARERARYLLNLEEEWF